jgi:DNA-binding response OmpR family regulator
MVPVGEIVMGTIVLVDDDDDLRALHGQWLRSAGYTVWEAPGGSEALLLVREHRPCLLILDVWMPGMNGFEVLEALRHDPAATAMKVMMLSNLGDSDSRLECFEMGASRYVIKGQPLVELLREVRELLEEAASQTLHPFSDTVPHS